MAIFPNASHGILLALMHVTWPICEGQYIARVLISINDCISKILIVISTKCFLLTPKKLQLLRFNFALSIYQELLEQSLGRTHYA